MACVAVPTQNHSSHRRQPFQRSALQIGIKMSNILKECSASAGIQEEEEEEVDGEEQEVVGGGGLLLDTSACAAFFRNV